MTMPPPGTHIDCLPVADDLIIARGAGLHLAVRGLRLATVLAARGSKAANARVVALGIESRDLPPAKVRYAVATLGAELPLDSVTRVFKKVDSTLRGNTGLEIAAALEAFRCGGELVA